MRSVHVNTFGTRCEDNAAHNAGQHPSSEILMTPAAHSLSWTQSGHLRHTLMRRAGTTCAHAQTSRAVE